MLYNDFVLYIAALSNPAGNVIQVLDSPAGSTEPLPYPLSVTSRDITRFTQRFEQAIRAITAQKIIDGDFIKDFGSMLFESFPTEIRSAYRSSTDLTLGNQKGLRILLRMNRSSLLRIPWECLYDVERKEYISLNPMTPVVRFPNVLRPTLSNSQPASLPINILIVHPNPVDNPVPGLDEEVAGLSSILSSLEKTEKLRLHYVTPPVNWKNFLKTFQDNDIHILHFIGHSEFDFEKQIGNLIFESNSGSGKSERRTADEMGQLAASKPSLLLAVMNSCQSGITDSLGLVSGISDQLAAAGIPVVLGMQFKITGHASTAFSKNLYSGLFPDDGEEPISLVEAVSIAKNSLKSHLVAGSPEWLTPIVVSRVSQSLPVFLAASNETANETLNKSPIVVESKTQADERLIEVVFDSSVTVNFVVEKIRQNQCVFVVGSGFAELLGFPSLQAVANHLLDKMKIKPYAYTFPDSAENYEYMFTRRELISELQNYVDSQKINKDRSELREAINSIPIKTYIDTNNLNNLIRDPKNEGMSIVNKGDHLWRVNQNKQSVVKIYGDIKESREDEITLTASDHIRFLDRRKDFAQWLAMMERDNSIVYVGFDLDGIELQLADSKIRPNGDPYTGKSFLLSSTKTLQRFSYIKWERRGLEIVNLPVLQFLNMLREAIKK